MDEPTALCCEMRLSQKPYNPAILLAKIAALLKKAYRSSQTEIYMWKEATLQESSMIEYKGQKAELTKNELKILYYLFKNLKNLFQK